MKRMMIGTLWAILSLAIWISFAYRAARIAFQLRRRDASKLA